MKTISFITLGCRANQAETELMKDIAEKKGFSIIGPKEKADIIVINTCTVTSLADRKSRATIRASIRRKAKKIIVTGCLADTDIDEIKQINGVDVILTNKEKASFNKHLPQILKHNTTKRKINVRDNLIIQTGCNNFCTYCIVPYARGRETDYDHEKILSQAKRMASKGIKELILTGTNTGAYNKLPLLLNDLSKIEDIKRIRLSSIEPFNISQELVDSIIENPKVCRHLHIPLQNGSDKILEKMNRKYSRDDFYKMTQYLKMLLPDIAITTDIIVGFPGETEEDFEDTLHLVNKIKFNKIHIFKYSKRKGTPASEMKGQTDPRISENRSKQLQTLGKEISRKHHEKLMGQTVEVLIENKNKKNELLEGLTGNYIRVFMKGDVNNIGNIVKIQVMNTKPEYVTGSFLMCH